MPLTVDYRENYASAGRLPGGFLKREARPSEYEILISRLIDRAMRPMFPNNYHAETQVLVTLISSTKKFFLMHWHVLQQQVPWRFLMFLLTDLSQK